jgi:hypothetical protein
MHVLLFGRSSLEVHVLCVVALVVKGLAQGVMCVTAGFATDDGLQPLVFGCATPALQDKNA